jgi:hypothetical protein
MREIVCSVTGGSAQADSAVESRWPTTGGPVSNRAGRTIGRRRSSPPASHDALQIAVAPPYVVRPDTAERWRRVRNAHAEAKAVPPRRWSAVISDAPFCYRIRDMSAASEIDRSTH